MKRIVFACISVLFFTGCLGNLLKDPEEPVYKERTWNPKIEKFSTCAEIDTYIQEHTQRLTEGDVVSSTPQSGGEPQPYQNQVEGVLEGDELQVTPDYFFFARPQSIEVVHRSSFSQFKTISNPYFYNRRLLTYDDKLVFVGGDYTKTIVQIYDVKKDFKKIYEKYFVGFPEDFRIANSKLHVITRYYYQQGGENIDCAQIYRPNVEDGVGLITFVNQVDLGHPLMSAKTTGVMGRTDFFHMTADELLLFQGDSVLPSHFSVLKLGDGQPQLEQVQTYQGYIKDRWSVLVKNNSLVFAATAVSKVGSMRENKLVSFEKMRGLQYEQVSESVGFGAGQSIRAVRYFMDKAYVVTFQQVDPLFIFDIQDIKNLELLSFLESPGFSTQLRELSDGVLLGLGVDDRQMRLKVSLFDVLDPLHLNETQAVLWGDGSSWAYSEALTDPKALFISKEKDRIAFPVYIEGADSFAGAIVLDYHGKQVKETGRITHQAMREQRCSSEQQKKNLWWTDIQRVFEDQGEVYSFSRFGILKSSGANLATNGQVSFSPSQGDCVDY